MGEPVAVPISRGKVAVVDAADAHLVAPFRWYAEKKSQTWYARRTIWTAGRSTTLQMHTWLTGFTLTDHINGNGLDNRRSNLRPATPTQNCANSGKRRGDTSSPFKGVTWNGRQSRWVARIRVNKRMLSLGYHPDEFSAALAYDAAARAHFGEFAALNFPRPGERGALHAAPADLSYVGGAR